MRRNLNTYCHQYSEETSTGEKFHRITNTSVIIDRVKNMSGKQSDIAQRKIWIVAERLIISSQWEIHNYASYVGNAITKAPFLKGISLFPFCSEVVEDFDKFDKPVSFNFLIQNHISGWVLLPPRNWTGIEIKCAIKEILLREKIFSCKFSVRK